MEICEIYARKCYYTIHKNSTLLLKRNKYFTVHILLNSSLWFIRKINQISHNLYTHKNLPGIQPHSQHQFLRIVRHIAGRRNVLGHIELGLAMHVERVLQRIAK